MSFSRRAWLGLGKIHIRCTQDAHKDVYINMYIYIHTQGGFHSHGDFPWFSIIKHYKWWIYHDLSRYSMIFLTIGGGKSMGTPPVIPRINLHWKICTAPSVRASVQGGLTALGYFCHRFSGELMGSYSESEWTATFPLSGNSLPSRDHTEMLNSMIWTAMGQTALRQHAAERAAHVSRKRAITKKTLPLLSNHEEFSSFWGPQIEDTLLTINIYGFMHGWAPVCDAQASAFYDSRIVRCSRSQARQRTTGTLLAASDRWFPGDSTRKWDIDGYRMNSITDTLW